MNRDKKVLYAFSATFLGALLLTVLFSNELWQRIALAVLAALSFTLATLLIKKRSILKLEKSQVLWFLPTIGVIAVATYYLLGVHFGYVTQTVQPSSVWLSVLPMAVVIGFSERTRQILLAQNNKLVSALTFISFVVMDALLLQGGISFRNSKDLVDFFGMVLFPAITSNVLYHFTSKRYGMIPVAIYRFFMACYAIVMPIRPAVPSALLAFLRLVLPLAVFLFLRMLYERKKFVVSKKNIYIKTACSAVCLILMTLWIMLISCQFRYGLLVIASESMTGSIDRGDAIIYEQYDDELIQEGQVIVFEKNGVVTIHRVVRIENLNNEVRYYTKGDANDSEDRGYVTSKEIVGTTDVTIKWIGYPTLWMREIFRK